MVMIIGSCNCSDGDDKGIVDGRSGDDGGVIINKGDNSFWLWQQINLVTVYNSEAEAQGVVMKLSFQWITTADTATRPHLLYQAGTRKCLPPDGFMVLCR